MLFSEASGHKVVSTTSAETVGRLDRFVVDPASHQVVALQLKKSSGGDVLRWTDIAAFGADAVTVESAERLGSADDALATLADKHHDLLGKRVLCSTGDDLGSVDDVEFDPATGQVVALSVGDGWVDGPRLIGIGSYAVVVRTAPDSA